MRICLLVFSLLVFPVFALKGLEISGKKIPVPYIEGLNAAFEKSGDNARELRAAFGRISQGEVAGLAFLCCHHLVHCFPTHLEWYSLGNLFHSTHIYRI